MSDGFEKRREARLNYNWPIWFNENYDQTMIQGQMIDISSCGAAFTCYADKCPHDGQEITARFSVPAHVPDDNFDLESFIRKGHVCRIDEVSAYVRKVAIQFADPLPFKPADTINSEQKPTPDKNKSENEDDINLDEEELTTFEEYEKRRQRLIPSTVDLDSIDDMMIKEANAMALGHFAYEIKAEIF
jgi:hypothetical protein